MFTIVSTGISTAALAALLVVVTTTCSFGSVEAACNTGILVLEKYNWNNLDLFNYDCNPSADLTINNIKSLCGLAFKAEVTSQKIIKLIPLSTATYKYRYPGPGPSDYVFPCKYLNASGIFNAGSTTAGTVTLFDDVGGPLTYLNRTGNVIRLNPGHTYGYKGPGPICKYNYTVVSGCFMGISAPASRPALSCPQNWYITTGFGGVKYCTPCSPGYFSDGGKVTKCMACPAGYYNSRYGDNCKKCDPGYFSNKTATIYCDFCEYYDNKYTDGTFCKPCPAQSWVAQSKPGQCARCNKGVKCCTAGSDGSCLQCKAGQLPDTKNYTSVFALASASSASCLMSDYALCSSKWKATIDFTCGITVEGLQKSAPDGVYCDWSATVPVKGLKAAAKTDFAYFDGYGYSEQALLAGNATKVHAPFLDFYFPFNKCTLTYRALTTPAATLLGVPPKAGTSTDCPAGKYLDKKPGSCLPCPPGTYNPKPSSKTSCDPCPAGRYNRKYGSSSCAKCGAGLTSPAGATGCFTCGYDQGYAGNNKCVTCPSNTGKYTQKFPGCIGDNNGNVCCGAGDCGGAPACPKPLPQYNQDSNVGAVFQLLSTNLAGGSCRNASLLSCLGKGAYVNIAPQGNSFTFNPIMQPKCLNGGDFKSPLTLYGGFVSDKRGMGAAYVYTNDPSKSYTSGYEFLSNKAKNTLTVVLSKSSDPTVSLTSNLTGCSATFKLIAGYAFDLKPPAAAKCPSSTIPVQKSGRTFCRVCSYGSFTKGGSCVSCPPGSYQPLMGATSCNKCPAGSSCYEGTAWPSVCYGGYYADVPGLAECKQCSKDHFPEKPSGAKKCLNCPKYTKAPAGASACGVPFMTKF